MVMSIHSATHAVIRRKQGVPKVQEEWEAAVPRSSNSQPSPVSIRPAPPECMRSSTSCAPCSQCRRLMVVTKAGVIQIHGPVSKCCSGSGKTPSPIEQARDCAAPPTSQSSPTTSHPIRRNPPSSHIVSGWLPCKVLKRVLCASRMLAANKLASILDDIVERDDDAVVFCYSLYYFMAFMM